MVLIAIACVAALLSWWGRCRMLLGQSPVRTSFFACRRNKFFLEMSCKNPSFDEWVANRNGIFNGDVVARYGPDHFLPETCDLTQSLAVCRFGTSACRMAQTRPKIVQPHKISLREKIADSESKS